VFELGGTADMLSLEEVSAVFDDIEELLNDVRLLASNSTMGMDGVLSVVNPKFTARVLVDRIVLGTRKRDRAKLPHLHFIHAEARLFLEILPAAATISTVFILFPDPWPNNRHHKNRIIQPGFLSAAARKMTHDGLLCFRTDHQPYFEHAFLQVSKHPEWTPTPEAWPFEFTTVFQSRASQYHSLIARRSSAPSSHKSDGENFRSP
jgi:hypothetical protein